MKNKIEILALVLSILCVCVTGGACAVSFMQIEEANQKIAALESEMEAAACDYEKLTTLTAARETAQSALDALYERWEQLSEEAEA